MGGIESKFNALLEEGKEEPVIAMWEANLELLKDYNPNVSIRWNKHGDTPLHCATRSEMLIVVTRLMEKGGDPFLKNADEQTPLHLVCRSARNSSRTSKKRATLLKTLLSKVPAPGGRRESGPAAGQQSGNEEGSNSYLDIKDKSKNTPLHLAATSGLLDCVEILMAHGAPLFVYNIAGQTPCDAAGSAKQLIVAKLLESHMVLKDTDDATSITRSIDTDDATSSTRSIASYTPETLQILKKEVVQRLATQLHISPLPTELLLQGFGWSEELVIEAWDNDPISTCERAGLDIGQVIPGAGSEMSLTTTKAAGYNQCEICFEDIPSDQRVTIPCRHLICNTCWPRFLEVQIQEAGGREIRCPAYGCFRVVPNEVIATIVSSDLFQRYTTLNLQQFVSEYSQVKWCPHPGCGLAVGTHEQKSAERKKKKAGLNVWCGKGHAFCWTCNMEAHEPCGCELWERWKMVVMEMTAGAISKTLDEAIANTRWLASFTKPCPNCSAPIQKNEGCNHMTCKKCRSEFCWICFGSWKLHGAKTGGYFSCNRYKEQEKARQGLEKAIRNMEDRLICDVVRDSEEKKKRFDHYHSRYQSHCHGVQIELKLFESSAEKSNQLIMLRQVLERNVAKIKEAMVSSGSFGSKYLNSDSPSTTNAFTEPPVPSEKRNIFEDCLFVLINSRQVLAASYALGYFISDSNECDRKPHESIQADLEEAVEHLSQMVNRPYLCTSHRDLVQSTRAVEKICKTYLTSAEPIAQRTWAGTKDAYVYS